MPTVFYLGATGYIGGSVLADLLKIYPDLEVTALVRNTAHIDAVRGLGVEVVQGTFSDVDLITSHARKADITVNAADTDDVALSTAILAGHKARVVEDKQSPAVLLHTSGVAVFLDDGKEGKHDPNSKLWDDGDEADIRAITPQMLHGQVDAPILRASEEGYTESYIICPAAIVGPSTGPVPSASFFFHFMTQLALGFKKAIYVGEGSNIFYTVRLDDLVDLYGRVFARILDRVDAKASPYARYYITVSTPLSWKDIMTVFGGVLARKGKLGDATAHSISLSEAPYPASIFLGASQHARGERAKALGWVPRPVVLEDWAEVGISASLEKLQQ
ncbi:NAD-binding protein [Lactarius akahatsu]|uniref:NAD-binding protein n=1 Tax=Lactarius akahatsu TaxID=416441 RepID=A0AAD4Q5L9_9AGAM|nr:NAD-binding protein [Lactarius akahatsu]